MLKSFLLRVLSLAGFTAALAFPASFAQAGPFFDDEGTIRGIYLQAEGGIALLPDQQAVFFQPAGNIPLTIDHDEAVSYGGQVGVVLPEGFRVEAEGIYHEADRTGFGPAGTDTEILLLMANLLYDMDVGDFPIRPYWGGGVGAGLVNFNVPMLAGSSFDDDSTSFAWQLTTGARLHATSWLFLDVNYTYARLRGPGTNISNALLGGDVGLDFQRIGLHGLRGGVGVEF